MLAEGDPLFDETLGSPQGAFGGQNMAETHQESMSKLARQLGHVKEILGLAKGRCQVIDLNSCRGGSTLSSCQ